MDNIYKCRATTKLSLRDKFHILISSELEIGFDIRTKVPIDESIKPLPVMETKNFWESYLKRRRSRKIAKQISKQIDLRKVDLEKIKTFFDNEYHKETYKTN